MDKWVLLLSVTSIQIKLALNLMILNQILRESLMLTCYKLPLMSF